MTGSLICFESKGHAVLKGFEIPELKPGEVLVANEYTVVSAGTEIANFIGLPNTSGEFPWYPGYCGAGRVTAVGEGVESLTIGDRVITDWGGHRSHMVRHASSFTKIVDDRVDSLDAAFAVIASFSFLGVRKLKIELGESVMIAGQGILGVFALQIARLSGAIPVLVADFDPKRRELALRLGADCAFDPGEKEYVGKIMDATEGKGVNAVVEVTGVAAALQQALEYVAWQGRISLLGCTRVSDASIDYYKYVHRRGISLIGAHTFARPKMESQSGQWTERDDYCAFLKLVAAGRMHVRPLISEVISPERAPALYELLAKEKNPPLGIVIDWRGQR